MSPHAGVIMAASQSWLKPKKNARDKLLSTVPSSFLPIFSLAPVFGWQKVKNVFLRAENKQQQQQQHGNV